VEIGGDAPTSFEQVLLPEFTIEVVEYREGSEPVSSSRRMPGRTSFTTLVLRRGFNGSLYLYEWWAAASQGDNSAVRDLTVSLLNEDHDPVATWRFRRAFPARYLVSPLDAQDGGSLVETIELAFDSADLD
jgi:phage tail-like protein